MVGPDLVTTHLGAEPRHGGDGPVTGPDRPSVQSSSSCSVLEGGSAGEEWGRVEVHDIGHRSEVPPLFFREGRLNKSLVSGVCHADIAAEPRMSVSDCCVAPLVKKLVSCFLLHSVTSSSASAL